MKGKVRPYTCKDAKKDIDFFFSKPSTDKDAETALWRAINHMTKGTTKKNYNISCKKCYAYYEEKKREHCGG